MPKPPAIVILAPRQVMTKNLGVKLGTASGGGRSRSNFSGGGASDGGQLTLAEYPGLRHGDLSAGVDATELQRDGHGDGIRRP